MKGGENVDMLLLVVGQYNFGFIKSYIGFIYLYLIMQGV